VFVIGMGLSSYCRVALRSDDREVMSRRLAVIGGLALCGVVAGIIAWHFGKDYLPVGAQQPHMVNLLRSTLHPASKTPPSPAYLLLYGGCGLLMTAAFFHGRPRWLFEHITGKAAVIGKASLLCFIVQDWLFFVIPDWLGFVDVTSVGFWFAYFGMVVTALFVLAKYWIHSNGNRLFTVGLKRMARPAAVDSSHPRPV
jgi:hypothetical protein